MPVERGNRSKAGPERLYDIGTGLYGSTRSRRVGSGLLTEGEEAFPFILLNAPNIQFGGLISEGEEARGFQIATVVLEMTFGEMGNEEGFPFVISQPAQVELGALVTEGEEAFGFTISEYSLLPDPDHLWDAALQTLGVDTQPLSQLDDDGEWATKRNGVASGTRRATFVAVSPINGEPALLFDGVDDRYYHGPVGESAEYTQVFVFHATAVDARRALAGVYDPAGFDSAAWAVVQIGDPFLGTNFRRISFVYSNDASGSYGHTDQDVISANKNYILIVRRMSGQFANDVWLNGAQRSVTMDQSPTNEATPQALYNYATGQLGEIEAARFKGYLALHRLDHAARSDEQIQAIFELYEARFRVNAPSDVQIGALVTEGEEAFPFTNLPEEALVSPDNMTTNTAPAPYVASASGEYLGVYFAYYCFNGPKAPDSSGDAWLHFGVGSAWVQIDLGAVYTITKYRIFFFNASYNPNACDLHVSEDIEANLASTDVQAGFTLAASPGFLEFTLAAPTPARLLRLHVSGGASGQGLSGVEYYGY